MTDEQLKSAIAEIFDVCFDVSFTLEIPFQYIIQAKISNDLVRTKSLSSLCDPGLYLRKLLTILFLGKSNAFIYSTIPIRNFRRII